MPGEDAPTRKRTRAEGRPDGRPRGAAHRAPEAPKGVPATASEAAPPVRAAAPPAPPVPRAPRSSDVATPVAWQKPEVLGMGFGLCALGLAIVLVYYSYLIERGWEWCASHFGAEFYRFAILGGFLIVTGSVFLGMYFATPRE